MFYVNLHMFYLAFCGCSLTDEQVPFLSVCRRIRVRVLTGLTGDRKCHMTC